MSQLIFDIAGDGDSVTDFFSQQELITLAETDGRPAGLHYLSCPTAMLSPLRDGASASSDEQLFQRIK